MRDAAHKKCTDCSLHENCNANMLYGRGSFSKSTKYFIILDYPSKSDDKWESPVSGDTRDKINYFFEKTKIDNKSVYITYALKCRPKKNEIIKQKQIEECRKYLFNEITSHAPEVIITMGKHALQAVCEIKGVSVKEFRGHFIKDGFNLEYSRESVISSGDNERRTTTHSFSCKIIPTWGLEGSLLKWEYNEDIIRDFNKAKNFVVHKVISKTQLPIANTILSKKSLKSFLEKYREVKYATTDFETTGLNFKTDKIINVGYCSGDNVADILYLEPYNLSDHVSTFEDEEDQDKAFLVNNFLSHNYDLILKVLKTVNGFKHLNMILHNGKFDAKFAAHNKIPYRNFYFDTLIADSLIDENLGHSLNVAMERRDINFGPYDTELWKYTNKDSKTKKSYQFVPPSVLERYLAIDVYGDFLLYKKQLEELEKENLTDYMFNQKMKAVRNILKSEYIGVKGDRQLLKDTSILLSEKEKKIHERLIEITKNEDFNPNSPKQICDYMISEGYPFRKLKIDETANGYSTNSVALKRFTLFKKWKEFPELILEYKKLDKVKSTYVDGKDGVSGMLQYLDENDRMHTSFNMWTPRTGRYSSNSPGLQTWPRPIKGMPNMRNFIIASKGYSIFECDYKQLEIFILAALSKDQELVSRLQKGVDLHSANVIDIGKQLDLVPNWVTYNHVLYGVGKESEIDQNFLKEIKSDILNHGSGIDFKEVRTQHKSLAFGLNYGKTADSFSKDFKITLFAAEELVDTYFALYSGVKSYRDNEIRNTFKRGYLTLLSGRKRRFHGGIDWVNSDHVNNKYGESFVSKITREGIERQIMNTPIQGNAHDVFEQANIRLMSRIKKEKIPARILLSIHDGIIGECRKGVEPYVKELLKEEMPTTFFKNTKTELLLDVDIDFYKTCWYGEKLKNID